MEVTVGEARVDRSLETQWQWLDQAIARSTSILLALFSLVTVLDPQLSPRGQTPVSITAWYHQDEPTFTDCLPLLRGHIWRTRYSVNSAAEAEFVPFAREGCELFLTGLPLAA